ncbi:oxalate/formate antiport family MFS transporter [Sulfolobales archaeon HS-7]|nr:oxalate/formate antiport family MFS transporter [Sulfolobales archaeon HS-7]
MDKRIFLLVGFTVMCFNSLYQYSWNAFFPLFQRGFDTGVVQLDVAFSLFTIFSTVFQLIGGSWADIKGPKVIGTVSAIASSIGFLGTSFSKNLYQFYFFWSVGSSGEGVLYGIASNLAIKWFSSRRGFATGLVSLGFGLGATIVNPFIYEELSFRFPTLIIGLIEMITLPTLLWISDFPKGKTSGLSPKAIVRNKKWWFIYFSYILIVTPLLIMSSSLTTFSTAKDIEILISVFPFFSGIGRPLIGYASDRLGRTRTLIVSELIIILASALSFVNIFASAVLIGFFGGSMIPLYFSLVGDVFGSKFSTSNTALLYTGKAVSGILGGIVFGIIESMNITWSKIFMIICTTLALLLLLYITGEERK